MKVMKHGVCKVDEEPGGFGCESSLSLCVCV